MEGDIETVLITREQIARRVAELAAEILADHSTAADEITLVPILTGAMIFCADLMRHLPVRMKIGLLGVSSYPGKSVRSQGPKFLSDQLGDLHGRHVLLIDDILDSGGTLRPSAPWWRPSRRRP